MHKYGVRAFFLSLFRLRHSVVFNPFLSCSPTGKIVATFGSCCYCRFLIVCPSVYRLLIFHSLSLHFSVCKWYFQPVSHILFCNFVYTWFFGKLNGETKKKKKKQPRAHTQTHTHWTMKKSTERTNRTNEWNQNKEKIEKKNVIFQWIPFCSWRL